MQTTFQPIEDVAPRASDDRRSDLSLLKKNAVSSAQTRGDALSKRRERATVSLSRNSSATANVEEPADRRPTGRKEVVMVSHVARWSGSLLPRAHWLGTVAAGALSLAFGGTALAGPNACTTSGAVATCTGNQSAGIASGVDFTAPPVTTLNVNNLTQAIAPASGIDGVEFNSAAAITITSNTGSFGITTQGTNAVGIYAFTTGAGAVTVTSTGNINTQGTSATGILAQSLGAGNVTVTSTGNIATQGTDATGIFAESISAGAVTVTSTGNFSVSGTFEGEFGSNVASYAGKGVARYQW